MRFDATPRNCIAFYDPDKNEIVVNQDLKDASQPVLVAHLGNDGSHAAWQGRYSIDEEYHAYCTQGPGPERSQGQRDR